MTIWAVAAALFSAACYALAAALQQVEADHTPRGGHGEVRLLWHLCRRPRWLLGIAAMGLGAATHTLALSLGPVRLVQPIGVAVLLFALPLGARLHAQRLRARDWWAAACVTVGLLALLRVGHIARTGSHTPHLSTRATIILVAATATAVASCALWVRHRTSPHRAVALAACAGIAFGASSALVRVVGSQVVASGPAALLGWPTAALALVAPVGFVLCQHAYRDGSLGAGLSTMTVADPLTAIAFAATLLGEGLHTGLSGAAAAAGAGALIVVGIVVLSGRQGQRQTPICATATASASMPVRRVVSITNRRLSRIE